MAKDICETGEKKTGDTVAPSAHVTSASEVETRPEADATTSTGAATPCIAGKPMSETDAAGTTSGDAQDETSSVDGNRPSTTMPVKEKPEPEVAAAEETKRSDDGDTADVRAAVEELEKLTIETQQEVIAESHLIKAEAEKIIADTDKLIDEGVAGADEMSTDPTRPPLEQPSASSSAAPEAGDIDDEWSESCACSAAHPPDDIRSSRPDQHDEAGKLEIGAGAAAAPEAIGGHPDATAPSGVTASELSAAQP